MLDPKRVRPDPSFLNIDYFHFSSRREWLEKISLLAIAAGLGACATGIRRDKPVRAKVDLKYQWTRRQEWTGLESVAGVLRLGDRYLLTHRTDGMGWAFPGGLTDPNLYGGKSKDNKDLLKTIIDYVFKQTMIGVLGHDAVLIAYGYALDTTRNRTLLQHWFALSAPSNFPPIPHADLQNSTEAKWVALDDPMLGKCLQNRIQEYTRADAGGTVVLEPFHI